MEPALIKVEGDLAAMVNINWNLIVIRATNHVLNVATMGQIIVFNVIKVLD